MRTLLFLAIVANSCDLFATAVGIHGFGNREGNPLLSGVASEHWLAFVAIKGSEWDAYQNVVSSWEREYLLLNV